MVHVLQTLEVLVRLAVQLEIRLQVGFIGTKFADEVAGDQGEDLALSRSRPVNGQVVAEGLQRIGGKIVAHAAVVEMRGVRIRRFGWRVHTVGRQTVTT